MVETDNEMLETDSSMEQEAELDKLEDQLSFMKMKEFRIGTQNYTLNHEEPIFVAAGPFKKTTDLTDCGTCKIVTFTDKKKKDIFYCQFCGVANCKDCCNKSRFYPKGKLDGNGEKPRGKICKLCDRKFLIRQVLLESQAKLQQKKHSEEKLLADFPKD